MRRPHPFRLLFAAALAALAGLSARVARAPVASEAVPRMRGVCWEANGRIGPEHLQPLQTLGATWISQTPFGWSSGVDAPAIRLATGARVWWGESDSGLVQTAAWARDLGMKTLLKPHLWVRHGAWVGDLEMRSEADWLQWFAAYEDFILHYARLAEEHGMEAFAVGTELRHASTRTADWRRIVARVRAVYSGPLTYCANWSDEVEHVQFWDALDFVGVQAYYPLADSLQRPAADEIRAAWRPWAARLEALARRTGKPVVFTEVGYRSLEGALHRPWDWDVQGDADPALQRDAYQALFETFWDAPWFGGTFVWKWHPTVRRPERWARDFTPQGKPALEVLRAWYARPTPGAAATARGNPVARPR
jgi:hypothetical protein